MERIKVLKPRLSQATPIQQVPETRKRKVQ